MVHFDFELPKTTLKGKLADAGDGVIKITHTLQGRKAQLRKSEW